MNNSVIIENNNQAQMMKGGVQGGVIAVGHTKIGNFVGSLGTNSSVISNNKSIQNQVDNSFQDLT
jgi:hypothetical protein